MKGHLSKLESELAARNVRLAQKVQDLDKAIARAVKLLDTGKVQEARQQLFNIQGVDIPGI